jgi:hypothetical protein
MLHFYSRQNEQIVEVYEDVKNIGCLRCKKDEKGYYILEMVYDQGGDANQMTGLLMGSLDIGVSSLMEMITIKMIKMDSSSRPYDLLLIYLFGLLNPQL